MNGGGKSTLFKSLALAQNVPADGYLKISGMVSTLIIVLFRPILSCPALPCPALLHLMSSHSITPHHCIYQDVVKDQWDIAVKVRSDCILPGFNPSTIITFDHFLLLCSSTISSLHLTSLLSILLQRIFHI
jgi:hypothetical protein